jgi:hypothetical protein
MSNLDIKYDDTPKPTDINDINSLYANAFAVHTALERLMKIQESESQVLRGIANNSIIENEFPFGRDLPDDFVEEPVSQQGSQQNETGSPKTPKKEKTTRLTKLMTTKKETSSYVPFLNGLNFNNSRNSRPIERSASGMMRNLLATSVLGLGSPAPPMNTERSEFVRQTSQFPSQRSDTALTPSLVGKINDDLQNTNEFKYQG